tara:strand:+ start:4560 stop:4922 length:363 start_codon:yes stop_codon:yes gene_type:complete
MMMVYLKILLIITAGIFSAFGNLYLKKFSIKSKNIFEGIISFDYELIIGLLFYVLNLLLFIVALKSINVSKAYPILAATSFLTTYYLANLFLGEKIEFTQVIGIGIILTGIIVLSSTMNQ